MINLSKALITKAASSDFLSDVGGRLFKGRAPQGAEYPYAVYLIVSNAPEKTYTEDFENTIIQFSLFSAASGSTEIEGMYADLITLYDESTFDITDSTLIWMKRENATLMVEDHTTPAGTVQVWAYHVDYEVKTQAS
uniref:Tail protein n=1 Tax=viral metagenome TaxID=1070528 RepID=A0A6H1ZDL9_9ZZZZ